MRHQQRWTPREEARILEILPGRGRIADPEQLRKIAADLGRTEAAVSTRYRTLRGSRFARTAYRCDLCNEVIPMPVRRGRSPKRCPTCQPHYMRTYMREAKRRQREREANA